MTTTSQNYKFVKESGRWYIDLPEWTGNKADLEMVEGADKMLDYVGEGQPEVELILSETNFDDASVLTLIHDYSKQTGGGGIYMLESYQGAILNQEMWLCEVTEWVFGKLPPVIYFKKDNSRLTNQHIFEQTIYMKIETIAIHAGNRIDDTTKAVIQPIILSTTFERAADGSYPAGYIYSRSSNPNRSLLENVLAKLEGGADAASFASGNAAGMAVFQSLSPGTHIIAPDDMYHGLRNQLKNLFAGILTFDFIDVNDNAVLQSHIKPETGLIWIETPSNPLLKVTDIKKVVATAREHGIKVACDNTFATPICQQPLSLGADLVMHSATKYFGGHSDLMGGALITKEKSEWWLKIRQVQEMGGAIPSPMDCYMLARSIKTLPYRMRGHVHNAQLLAEFLEKHPKIEQVMYPGLPSHPQHEIAKTQMTGFGGMLSFTLKDGPEEAKRVINSLKLFTRATSLGGVESLIEHRATVEGPDTKTPFNLLRASIGLEHIDDLKADLAQALA